MANGGHENAPVSGQASEASNLINSTAMVFPAPYTVKGRVLGAFLRGDQLTHLDCWKRFNSSRLSGHVHILKHQCGWPVEETDEVVTTNDAGRKATIGTYWLPVEVIEQTGERGQQYAAETLRIELERRAA